MPVDFKPAVGVDAFIGCECQSLVHSDGTVFLMRFSVCIDDYRLLSCKQAFLDALIVSVGKAVAKDAVYITLSL